jgi:hypothetical protein
MFMGSDFLAIVSGDTVMNRFISPVAWAWLIIIGGLMITPDGFVCIACGAFVSKLIGFVSVAIGVAGFFLNRQSLTAGK